MADNNGWIGTVDQVQHVLRTVGADVDENGAFIVGGQIALFMGAGPDVVIGADAVYYRDGRQCSLAHAMAGTSYGVKVIVI